MTVRAVLAALAVVVLAGSAALVLLDRSDRPGQGGPGAGATPAESTTPPVTQPDEPGATLAPCPTRRVRVRALTMNLHGGRTKAGRLDLGRIATELRAWDADLVLLQEVDADRTRSNQVDQARWLGRRLGFDWAYGPTRRLDPGSTGNAILSRWPFDRVALRSLPQATGSYRRGLVQAAVSVRGRPITVVATHLDHVSPGARRTQAAAVARTVRRSGRPVLLGADLNAEPGTPPLRTLQRVGLADAWPAAGRGAGLTVPAAAPRRRIDYVLADAAFEPVRSQVLVSLVSDHRVVRTTFELATCR